ncbi:unnamed protein product [Notodromas monacha]|uniref:Transmembrane protein 231 n=1 Tax=Notodromas monacha TaxID=399045 RepID=A0A7R9GF20_9CRUS|nr:unnamed protein product [Notodromas monacha]CAG0920231.1 unnamed protein product [Notodromas monacha]
MVFSSFEKFLDEYEPYFRIPFIQHREEDTDEDGILDQLKLDLEFPLQETERSRGISLMLLFSFALLSPPLNTRRSRTIPNQYEFKTVGFLSTHQFIPLPSPGHPMTSFRLENAFPVRQLQAPSVDFRELAVGYLTSGNNSVITRYEEVLGYVDIVNDGPDIPRRIKASILVKYPREEKFERWVGLFESFKWAWVQYLAFFIPVYLCVQWLGNHLFAENKVFCHVVVGKEGNVASAFPTPLSGGNEKRRKHLFIVAMKRSTIFFAILVSAFTLVTHSKAWIPPPSINLKDFVDKTPTGDFETWRHNHGLDEVEFTDLFDNGNLLKKLIPWMQKGLETHHVISSSQQGHPSNADNALSCAIHTGAYLQALRDVLNGSVAENWWAVQSAYWEVRNTSHNKP